MVLRLQLVSLIGWDLVEGRDIFFFAPPFSQPFMFQLWGWMYLSCISWVTTLAPLLNIYTLLYLSKKKFMVSWVRDCRWLFFCWFHWKAIVHWKRCPNFQPFSSSFLIFWVFPCTRTISCSVLFFWTFFIYFQNNNGKKRNPQPHLDAKATSY